jgi:hypothetical protein
VTAPEHREESDVEILVGITDVGYATVGSNTFTFNAAITSVTNASGSKAGDNVTIAGKGFHSGYTKTNSAGNQETHSGITIRFGDSACEL